MNGYGMGSMMGWGIGFGWLWMIVILVLVGLLIAALIKYLRTWWLHDLAKPQACSIWERQAPE